MATEQFQAELLQNTPLGGGFFRMRLRWLPAQEPLPGQFVSLRVSALPFPLLRRPFAVSHYDPSHKTVSVIVKKRGSATDILSRKRPGERLDVIGPRGTSFPRPQPGHHAVLLAGGIGLGPMLFLAHSFRAAAVPHTLVFGCRSAGELPACEDLAELGAVFCTDDGSTGFHGTVTDYLEAGDLVLGNPMSGKPTRGDQGQRGTAAPLELYACGPTPMLAAVARLAEQRQTPCWVSMEQTLGCSMGACMGCVIRTTHPSGYARVCTEGPVFSSREIRWT